MKYDGIRSHEKPSYDFRQLGKIHGFGTQKLRRVCVSTAGVKFGVRENSRRGVRHSF